MRTPIAIFLVFGLACGGARSRSPFAGGHATTVAAPGPGAATYTTDAFPEGIVHQERDGSDAWARAVERGIEDAAASQSMTLSPDGRLGVLASWVLENLGQEARLPSNEVIAFFAAHLGLVEPIPQLLALGMPDPLALEQAVNTRVQAMLGRAPCNFYGASVSNRQGVTMAVVVLANRALDLEPVARRARVGGDLRLRGTLHAGFTGASVAIESPDGGVTRTDAGAGDRIDASLHLAVAGPYRIEVLAAGPHGDTVLANFPVYVGIEPPTSVTVRSGARVDDAAAMERELFDRIASTRRASGVRELVLHEGLSAMARAHSADMLRGGFVGHTSPTTGSARDRLARAGFTSTLVLENVSRGYDADEIHDALVHSPGHHANLVHDSVTHVGVGVVTEPEGDRTAFFVTEVFARLAEEVSVGEAPGYLIARVNAARATRGSPALESDPNLTAAAERAVASFFSDPSLSQEDVVDQASGEMRPFAIVFRRVAGVMAVVPVLEDAASLEPLLDANVTAIGIGVAQGTRPDTVRNAFAVVYVLGWRR